MTAATRTRVFTATGLVVLLVGPPLLLAQLAGWPLPARADMQQALDLRWISPSLALHLGASVAWAAWLYISACIVLAAAAQLRHQQIDLWLPHPLSAYVNTTVAVLLVSSTLGTGKHAAVPVVHVTSAPTAQVSLAASAAAIPETYTVQPRDTLWDIAETHLGDPLRWREIWKLNAGHVMADQLTFHDPNLIRPGWVLQMPHHESRTKAALPQVTVPPPDRTRVSTTETSAPPPATTTPAAEPAGAAEPGPATTPIEQPATSQAERNATLPVGLGLGAGAVGVLAFLIRRRRRATRQRPTGQRVPLPTGALVESERALRHSTNLDTGDTVARVLRLAAAVMAPEASPTLVTVRHTPEGVQLHFREPVAPPEPFTETEMGWFLPRQHFAATYGATDLADPTPALIDLGQDGDDHVYLNLEAYNSLSLDGEPDRVAALIDRAVVSLTAAPWSQLTEVCLTQSELAVGDLVDRAQVISLQEDLVRLQRLASSSREQHEVEAKPLAGRRWQTAEPTDGVTVVITTPHDPDLAALIDLATDPQTPIIALLTGPRPDVPCLTISSGGIELPTHDAVTAVAPQPILLDAARELIDLTEAGYVEPTEPPYAEVHEQSPAQGDSAEMIVRVLGPIDIDGPVPKLPPQLRDIVLYLALHRRGVSLGEMATALWPESLRSEKTLRNRMHELRRAIGGRVSLGPGWCFDATVTTDWAQFLTWAKGDLVDQQRALNLVRGQPLHDVKGDWASLEGFEAEMEASVVDLAIEVSEKLLGEGEPEAAMIAARAGLRACPWEERLYQLAMRSAADRGAIGEVRTLYAELRALLDIEEDDEPDPDTQALYEELLGTARKIAMAAADAPA